RSALAAGNDRARMPHPPAGRRSLSGDEADDRLLESLSDEGGCVLLRRPADLSDHDDSVRIGIQGEEFQGIDEGGADERVAPDTYAGTLTQVKAGQLVNGFVRQCPTFRHDADPALPADVSGNNAGLCLTG